MKIPGLFVTATNTDAGKTFVTALMAGELRRNTVRVGVYKPVCSGAEIDENGTTFWSDLRSLSSAVNDEFPLSRICPQRFSAPLSPPAAARLENRCVDSELLRTGAENWQGDVDFLLVEGVGGLLCPLTEDETVADLAIDLEFPLLVVSSLVLGTVNHTLLTLEAARSRGLRVLGVVLNEIEPTRNPQLIEASINDLSTRCRVPLLGIVPFGGVSGLRLPPPQNRIDWMALYRDALADAAD
ncbi:MAG: dethiobiotin synthase [Planctomycetes bacterium]|nr:dethiobiotin synthase [Planctomycetota bacterium]